MSWKKQIAHLNSFRYVSPSRIIYFLNHYSNMSHATIKRCVDLKPQWATMRVRL